MVNRLPRETVVPGPFGDRPDVPQPGVPDRATLGDGFQVSPDSRVPITDKVLRERSQPYAAAAAQRLENQAYQPAEWWGSLAAGLASGTLGNITRWFDKPDFTDDKPIVTSEYLAQVPMVFSKEEREFFDQHALGDKSAAWAVKQIKYIRDLGRAASDNTGSGLLGAVADPTNFIGGVPASLLRAGLTSRAIGSVSSAASGYVLNNAGYGIHPSDELLGQAFLDAIGGAFVGGRRGADVLGQLNARPSTPQQAPTVATPVAPPAHPAPSTPAPTAPPGRPQPQVPDIPTLTDVIPNPRLPDIPTLTEVLPSPEVPTLRDRVDLPADTSTQVHGGIPTLTERVEVPIPTLRDVLPESADRIQGLTAPAAPTQPPRALTVDWRATPTPAATLADPALGQAFQVYAKLKADKASLEYAIANPVARTPKLRDIQTKAAGKRLRKTEELLKRQEAKLHKLADDLGKEKAAEVKAATREPYVGPTSPYRKNVSVIKNPLEAAKEARKAIARAKKDPAWAAEQAKKTGNRVRKSLDKVDRSVEGIKVPTVAENRRARKRWRDRATEAGRRLSKDIVARAEALDPKATVKPTKAPKKPSGGTAPDSVPDGVPEPTRVPVSQVLDDDFLPNVDWARLDDEGVTVQFNGQEMRFHYGGGSTTPTTTPTPTPTPTPAPQATKTASTASAGGGQGNPPTVPPATPPGASTPPPGPNASLVQVLQQNSTPATPSTRTQKFAQSIAWNIHKTMSGFGQAGKLVADLLYDNVLEGGKTSVESVRAGVLSDLKEHQRVFEDQMLSTMRDRGYPLATRIRKPTEALQAQRAIEKELYREMAARQNSHAQKVPHRPTTQDKNILAMADQLDRISAEALSELQRAGVENTTHLTPQSGFVSRRWHAASMEDAIQRAGPQGSDVIRDFLKDAIQKRSPLMPDKVATQMAAAIRDRALRKGYFEDNLGQGPSGASKAELADSMRAAGVSQREIESVLDMLDAKSDKQGGSGYLKSRIGMDLEHSMQLPDGTTLSVLDLVDTGISQITDVYLQRVATDAAFARKGLYKTSDILKLREHLIHNTDPGKRQQAAQLFDDTIAHFKGLPQGAALNENFRRFGAFGRTVALAYSGLWQIVELGTTLAQYGVGAATKVALENIPGMRYLADADRGRMAFLLSEHSSRSMRLRPFLTKYEDGHGVSAMNGWDVNLQQLGNLVPVANAMKFVHRKQAVLTANLLADRLKQALEGNTKARKALAEYGIDDGVLNRVRADWDAHGWNVDDWSDEAWDAVRPGLYRAMDASVLHGRLGDVPAFAAFDPVGKALFTYRSFVLAAHNKLLAGGLSTGGVASLALMFMYQFPLAVLATQLQGSLLDREQDPVTTAVSQIGVLGLFSEPFKWLTGQSNAVGAPILIPADRAVKALQATVGGNESEAAARYLDLMPVIAANPAIRAISEQLKQ